MITMENMSRTLTKYTAWSVYFMILALYAFSLWALFEHRTEQTFWSLAETWRILRYSLVQAALSAGISVLAGLMLARSFFYLNFSGKALLYKFVSFIWALPSLVVIFAVIGVWGNSGWLASGSAYFGIPWEFNLYGLQGILIAHVFFNIPLVTKYALEGLRLIPSSQHQLATQLDLRGWGYFRVVEYPILKGILPYAFVNVFLICFTSFPIVLMLGGGPQYSTLEVAIYQAVAFEFDFAKAVLLIMVQVLVGILLQMLIDVATRFAFHHSKKNGTAVGTVWKPSPSGIYKRVLQTVLVVFSCFLLIPLCNVLWSGLSVPAFFQKVTHPSLWQAAWYSLLLSLVSSVSVIIVAYLIGLEVRQLAYRRQKVKQSILAGVSTYPLIMPVFLLAVGLFLLLMDVELQTWQLLLIVGICNGLMLLPYIYRLLFSAMWQALVSHDQLARSLGLTGWRRWWIVERTYLIHPLRTALALSMASGLGSFAVIAFFGSPDFSTLPYLLYQQLGSYRTEEAAVTALVLMLFTFWPFLFIEHEENK
ncbi:thiamine/thiamine pyrophosphate ABC transporter permease ThiP [Glaesserella sp.]|uniref:thiamine/thiamine pyrophosphate ABC transporter permease ThiP n=1 Tax=Glaesserella sp. TaxID=2094731 RepID=UPI0035A0DCF8